MTFTDILNAYGVEPDNVIDEQQQQRADEAASEDVGTIGSPEEPPAQPDPAKSELSDLDIAGQGTEATIGEGEDVDIVVEVENVGGQAGSFDVNLDINGESSSDETVELGSGESKSVTFKDVTGDLEPAEYDVTVSTGDNEVTGELSVELNKAAADPENSDIGIVDFETETEEGFAGTNGSGELDVSYQLDGDGESAPDIKSVVLEIEDQGAGDLEFDTVDSSQKNFESFEIAGGSLANAGGFNSLIKSVTPVNESTGPIVIEINQDFNEFDGDLELEPGDTVEFKTKQDFVKSGPENNGTGDANISIHLSQETGNDPNPNPGVFEATNYSESGVKYEESDTIGLG